MGETRSEKEKRILFDAQGKSASKTCLAAGQLSDESLVIGIVIRLMRITCHTLLNKTEIRMIRYGRDSTR